MGEPYPRHLWQWGPSPGDRGSSRMGQGGWGQGGGPSERKEGACQTPGPRSSRDRGAAEAPGCGGGQGLGGQREAGGCLPQAPSVAPWEGLVSEGLRPGEVAPLQGERCPPPDPPSLPHTSCFLCRPFLLHPEVLRLQPTSKGATADPAPTPCIGWGRALVLAGRDSPGGPNMRGHGPTPEGSQPSVPCRPSCRSSPHPPAQR